MRKQFILTLLAVFLYFHEARPQSPVTAPEEYLGYELGTAFTPYFKVVGYMETIAGQSPMAVIKKYGETYEGRPLNILIISSEDNIRNLEVIKFIINYLCCFINLNWNHLIFYV